jgi:phage terminase large subunit-like protein
LRTLEDQMCDWDPTAGYSPDRVDALVWALTCLMGKGQITGLDRSALGV